MGKVIKWLALRRFNHIDAIGLLVLTRLWSNDHVWTGIIFALGIGIISIALENAAKRGGAA